MIQTLGTLLEERAERYPQKTYLLFQEQEYSYGEFNKIVNCVANGFRGLGIKKGTHVGIHLPNCTQFLFATFALAKIGAPIVPTNLALKPNELSYILNHADAEMVVTNHASLGVMQSIQDQCDKLKTIVIVDSSEPLTGAIGWNQLLLDDGLNSTDAPQGDNVVALMYTSGTTALPKGVMLSHSNLLAGGRSWMWSAGFTEKDRTLTALPLFHANALIYSVIGSMIFGGSIAVLERFNPAEYWEQTRRYKATHMNFAGMLMSVVMDRPQEPDDAKNPIRVASSAMGSPELNSEFERRYQIKVIMNYSLTESTIALTTPISGPKPVKLGSIGWPMPSVPGSCEVRLIDEKGTDVPVGSIGEIILKSPAIMKGYYKQPDQTAEVLKDGWLYTGDLAYMDEDGCFWFSDRKKDVIKWKGENVSSQEVEFIISNHPKVKASAVIGVPDPLAMEEVKAYILLNDGENQDTAGPQEIIDWCRSRMATFKIPRYFEYREGDFPRAIGGAKILKRELKAEKEDLTQGCYDRKQGVWLK